MTVDREYGSKYVDFHPAKAAVRLCLMERGALARDAGTTKDGDGFPAIVLTCTAQSCEEVDALLAAAAAAGGRITAAAETPGGGYGGHFSDPDGFSWKVTHWARPTLHGRADRRGGESFHVHRQGQPAQAPAPTQGTALARGDPRRPHYERGHGRREVRRMKTCAVRPDLPFPHANQVTQAIQVIQVKRRRTDHRTGKTTIVTINAVTSIPPGQIAHVQLAALIRGRWGVEALHHIRDVTYREDACRARTGTAPRILAASANGPSVR